MIGLLRRWRDQRVAHRAVRLQNLLELYPHDHPWVVEDLLSGIPRIAAAASQTIREAAARRGDEERIRAIVREELIAMTRRQADVFMANALTRMTES